MDDVTGRRGLSGDDLGALVREVLSQPLSDRNRPIRLRVPDAQGSVWGPLLLAQRIDIHEALCAGITAHITCLSPRSDLPLESLLGVPIEVQLVTDRGGLRRFSLIVTEARAGSSDGGLALFQLTGRDVLAVMEQRINSRVFRRKSVIEISEVVLLEWRQRSASIARTFDFSIRCTRELGHGQPRYPEREFTLQYNESDAAFLRRLWKRSGIGWAFTSAEVADDDTPQQRLVLFDDSWQLPKNAAGPLRFHRDAATEKRDAITLWAPVRRLVPASVRRPSWDYLDGRVFDVNAASALNQGAAGDRLAAALQDSWIESPHTGATGPDHERLTQLRQRRHDVEAGCVHGASGVRDLAAGEWNLIEGQSELDRSAPRRREHLFIDVHHRADNNLPKALDERVQALLVTSESLPGWRPAPGERRYENRFIALQRDILYVPPWHPAEDWPPMPPLTALVVGPKDEAVHCDRLGRVKLRFLGLDPQDHAHAHGAGTNDDDSDSAWVRVDFGWAGGGFGHIHPLRVGMEVQVQFLNGDPDRPVVTGVVYNQLKSPAQFSHRGELPGNRHLSGTVTREINGQRGNQLRFDDTPGQISAQLASDHARSQLNLGALTQPRIAGHGPARGQGFELRSDESGALRTARRLLISAWQRLDAAGDQMSADEHIALMGDALQLFKSLGRYAAEHGALKLDVEPQAQLGTDAQSAAVHVTAPEGLVMTTPKTLLSYAGFNIDSVARQHLQSSSGGRYVVNAGQGVSIFAHQGGLTTIAHHGKWLAQSQHDDVQIDSAKNIQLTAADGRLGGAAKDEIVFVTAGGAYLKLKGGDVELGGPGVARIKTASHEWCGAASASAELPTFSASDLGRVPHLIRPTDGLPVEGAEVEIHRTGKATVQGTTGADGKSTPLTTEAFEPLVMRFFHKRS